MSKHRLVVFTDLDGTLLDHSSYSWEPAREALIRLRQQAVPLVLCSSKTRSEIQSLREELGNSHPFIVENGAAVIIPADYFEPGPGQAISFGSPRQDILDILRELQQQGFPFRGFAAMSDRELARLTGLTRVAAGRARDRVATEPLLWQGDAASLPFFREALARRGLQLLQGGRFLHVMGQFDKADAMAFLLEQYRRAYSGEQVFSVALGDSPNDQRMLEQADIPVVIRSGSGSPLRLAPDRSPLRPGQPGPAGWNAAILDILKRPASRSADLTE